MSRECTVNASPSGVTLGLLLSLLLFGCSGAAHKSPGRDDVMLAIEEASCDFEMLVEARQGKGAGNTTFCAHEVTQLTRIGGSCSPADIGYGIGDTLCIDCPNGSCRASATFNTNDGVILQACQVETQRINSTCRQIFPSGTCKYYITLP